MGKEESSVHVPDLMVACYAVFGGCPSEACFFLRGSRTGKGIGIEYMRAEHHDSNTNRAKFPVSCCQKTEIVTGRSREQNLHSQSTLLLIHPLKLISFYCNTTWDQSSGKEFH